MVKVHKPKSLTKLTDFAGRKISNLSRTSINMEHYGIVQLKKESSSVKPLVRVTEFRAVFNI